ncbi:MAG: cytochrome c family protein [Alphaproteobacteria bacterium]|nr:MAG: cytochrome c family protein [Alphaproteobacteria bacterium]
MGQTFARLVALALAGLFFLGASAVHAADVPPIGDALKQADPARGKKIFRLCMACHTIDKNGPNRIGPNLYGLVGRDIASVPGFKYSPALQKVEGKWDFEKLNHWLLNPRQFAPGNRMAFAGVRKLQDRADLIAYLNSMSDHPVPVE